MRLGHISDLHVFAMARSKPWRFANKRVLGGANLLLRRKNTHQTSLIHKAIAKLGTLGADHVAVTGDLTNLALEEEFDAARAIVDTILGAPEAVSIIPGNHDYYVASASRKRAFERAFSAYLSSDLPRLQGELGYPFCHLREGVAIVGLSSGVATPAFFSGGRVRQEQLLLAREIFSHDRVQGRARVLMVHHHVLPFEHAHSSERRRGISNAADVVRMARECAVDLLIHGHNHYYQVHVVPHLAGDGDMVVSEAGSVSQAVAKIQERMAKFNVYTIDAAGLTRIETYIWDASAQDFVAWRTRSFASRRAIARPEVVAQQRPAAFDWAGLAKRAGLTLRGGHMERHGERVPHQLEGTLALDDVASRERAMAWLWGTRLGVDTMLAGWQPGLEREQAPEKIFQKQDVPSVHGERLPWLVDARVLEWFEAHTGRRAVRKPWVEPSLVVVYVLEVGTHKHVLSEGDLERTGLTLEQVHEGAMSALFYQSYKVKGTQVERSKAGRIRAVRTVEGLGSSRLQLMPDFDLDVARARGLA
ncbi:MAG: metallophosphoesterase, partial [Myxococcota bacterium]